MSRGLQDSYYPRKMTALDEVWHRSFHRLFFRSTRLPLRLILPLLSGKKRPSSPAYILSIRKDMDNLLEQDIHNVKQGYYPKSTLDFPLLSYIYSLLSSGPVDALKVLSRAKRKDWHDLPSHVHEGDYPDYYLRNFHWQSDGWFSEASAKRYDASVQFLFGGAADIMRRMALPAVVNSLARPLPHDDIKILELACGTGSFSAQIRATFPQASLYAIDLSPDYIRYARKHNKAHHVSFLNANGESLPFKDESFDAGICHNLFHELPAEVRRQVFKEAHRVLKHQAIFSITDSAQLGDNPSIKSSIENFSKDFYEPYHQDYIQDDLGKIFEQSGFRLGESQGYLFSKAIYGLKI
jgi:ubiquinone/menaquinone biosynthesis C-methylase UbiE